MLIYPPSIAIAIQLAVAPLTLIDAIDDTPHLHLRLDNAPKLRHHHSHKSYGSTDSSTASFSSYDFYLYSMTFQPEFCRESSSKYPGCHNPQQYWEQQLTIHGLWPNRFDGTWPSECTAEKLEKEFYLKDDVNILNDMEEKWPNVKADVGSKDHTQFWEHEWSKHGTCTGLGQFDYFNSALGLLLETPSVVMQNHGSTVSKSDLLEGYGGGNMAALVCKSGYLSEVRACFEKGEDGMPGERMECPDKVLSDNSCGDEISVASFLTMADNVQQNVE